MALLKEITLIICDDVSVCLNAGTGEICVEVEDGDGVKIVEHSETLIEDILHFADELRLAQS